MLNEVWVVYEIKNVDNEMRLLGAKPEKKVEKSLAYSFTLLRENKYGVQLLQDDFNEYGEQAFECKVLKRYASEQKALIGLRAMKKWEVDNGWRLYNDKPASLIPKNPKNLMKVGPLKPKPRAKLDEAQVVCIRQKYRDGGNSYALLAQEFGVSQANIRAIIERRTWTQI